MEFKWRSALAIVAAAGITGLVQAGGGDPLPPEKLTAKPSIDAKGPLFLTGGERILVADVEGFKCQGVIGMPGWRGQFLLTKGGQAIVTNSWWERGTTGKRTDLVEVWDVPTLSKTAVEIEVPPRLALRGNDSTMVGLSANEQFLFLQNATPATSVSVVDMMAKKFVAEIPMPGCFGIYPLTAAPNRFVALCGDGTAASVTVDAKGQAKGVVRSSAFFDADVDPLFPKAARDGDTLYFASFHGSIYKVDISGPTAKLVEKFSIVEGVDGGWKPASENLLAFAPEGKVLFVSMFPNSKDGDHRVNGSQIWSVDVVGKTVLSRSTIKATNGFAYAPLPVPALIVNNPDANALERYIVQPKAGYSLYFDRQWVVASGASIVVR
jgi:methylamine dehydrogenase heavy chain